MRSFDNYLVGQLTIDEERFCDGRQTLLVGGPVLFSGYAGVCGGYKVGCVTKLADKDRHLLQPLYLRDITALPSKDTSGVLAIYTTENQETRELYLRGQADPMTIADIPEDVESKVWQFAGILDGQVDNELFPYLAAKGKVACDLQGYLREIQGDKIIYHDWKEKEKWLPYVTYLKADQQEAEIATGCADRREAAKILHSMGAKEILITYTSDAIVYDGENFYSCPLRPRNLSGRSGRGDHIFGSYITERTRKSIPDALLFASALVSLKMEHHGPIKYSRADVMEYMRQFYPEYHLSDPS